MNQLLLLLLALLAQVMGLPADLTTTNENDSALNTSSNSDGMGTIPVVPTTGTKCSTGCGIGIGVGCLVAAILSTFIFIMARRHKRKMHNTAVHKKWLAKQKALPDKPVPVPPTPTKF
ncbi:hypothetical protein GGI21_000284 [Coemansia aciculifera]|nr:hypothetical protein GGI21_000284 [Coemansia aciculifera]